MIYLSWASVKRRRLILMNLCSHAVMISFFRNLRQLFPKAVGHYRGKMYTILDKTTEEK